MFVVCGGAIMKLKLGMADSCSLSEMFSDNLHREVFPCGSLNPSLI